MIGFMSHRKSSRCFHVSGRKSAWSRFCRTQSEESPMGLILLEIGEHNGGFLLWLQAYTVHSLSTPLDVKVLQAAPYVSAFSRAFGVALRP